MGKVEKLSVALTSKQVEALREAVDEGDFASTSEAVRRAVTEWVEGRDRRREAALQRIRDLVDEGLASGIVQTRRTPAEISAAGHRRLAELKKLTNIG